MDAKMVSSNANGEQRRESGLSLIIIGFMLWFFDALILFFMPAGARLGQQHGFAILISVAFVAGGMVIGVGFYLRREKRRMGSAE